MNHQSPLSSSKRGCSSMVEWQLPKLHTGVRFPSPADFFFHSEKDMNEGWWTLSDVLTISSDQAWHQSLRTHISLRKARSGSPVTMASRAMEVFGDSSEAQKRLIGSWLRNWLMNGSNSKNWRERVG